jgi:hypothetical protein
MSEPKQPNTPPEPVAATEATREPAERSADPQAVYVNKIELNAGAFDLTAQLGTYRFDEAAKQWRYDTHTVITIPFGLAKVLLFQLAAQVEFFEHHYGPITVPQHLFPLLPSAADVGTEGTAHLAALRAWAMKLETPKPADDAALAAIVAATPKAALH